MTSKTNYNSYKYLKGEVIDINDEIINMNEGFDFDKKNYVVLKYMDQLSYALYYPSTAKRG